MSTMLFAHPGDAFAQAFRALEDLSDTVLDNLDSQATRGLKPLITTIEQTVTATGECPVIAPGSRGGWYAALIALDRALGVLDPARGGVRVPAALSRLRADLLNTGRLNTDVTGGGVLSRCAMPGRPGGELDGLAGRLGSLVYVPASEWAAMSVWRPRRDLPKSATGAPLRVAAVPFYGQRSDVDAAQHASGATVRYSLAPSVGLDRRGRVDRALAALVGSGAELGLVPEATLDEETLEHWRAALAVLPTSGSLKWVLIGTGAVETDIDGSRQVSASTVKWKASTAAARNRAVLVDRAGRVILAQDKQHGFTMVRQTVTRWGLDDQIPAKKMNEWLDSARTLQVLETSRGRLAILICEDLTRAMSVGRAAAAAGVSLVLAPIFGAVITEPTTPVPGQGQQWPQEAAAALASEIGTRTAAINSMAITRVFHGTSDASITLFAMGPDATGDSYASAYTPGVPVAGVDTGSLDAITDAVTARVTQL